MPLTLKIEKACRYQSGIHSAISTDEGGILPRLRETVYHSSENRKCSSRPIKRKKLTKNN